MTEEDPRRIFDQIASARQIALFLDYDGTLADFAPNPDQINPEPEVIALLTRLSRLPQLLVIVLSGRRLAHIQALLPVPHILLTGTYGLEMQLLDGQRFNRAQPAEIRPALDDLKPHWAQLIAGRIGFYLEDKMWALALHARYAEDAEAQYVLEHAHELALRAISTGPFRWMTGQKFCEVAPRLADKGITVKYLLNRYAKPGLLPIYIGDDAMDEEGFAAVKPQGGLSILVAGQSRATRARYRLGSPGEVRAWLLQLAEQLAAQAK